MVLTPKKKHSRLHLCLLDFGLRNRTGHHYNSARSILAAANTAGVEIRILAGDTLAIDPQFADRISLFFRTDLYFRSRLFPESENFDSWRSVGDRLTRDLRRIPFDVLASADIVVVPAVTPFHIWALCDWARTVLLDQHKACLVIHFMFAPTWSAWGRVCAPGPQMYREALELVRNTVGQRVFLTAELAASALDFERTLQLPIHVLPHPAFWEDKAATREREDSHLTPLIGVFGNSKREKGFHLLPEIIEHISAHLRERSPRFVIQVDHARDDAALTEAEAALGRIQTAQIEILRGSLSMDAYWAALRRVDLFLLPYDPARYRSRGSGLLSEAANLGVPVVGPAGTGIGDELQQARAAGIVYARYEPEAIAAATIEAIKTLAQLSEEARALSGGWRKTNSGLGYLRTLRAITGL
jgi:glycosyltransferase involved in cell wall biosynthesis